jgi:hypothetical protein
VLVDSLVDKGDLLAVEVDNELDLDVEDPATFVSSRAHVLPSVAVERMVRKLAAETTIVVGLAVTSPEVEAGRVLARGRLALDLDVHLLIVGARDVEVKDKSIALEVELDLAEDIVFVTVGVVLAKTPVVVLLLMHVGQEECLRVRHVRPRGSILAGVERTAVTTLDRLGVFETSNRIDLEGRGTGQAANEGSPG